MKKVLSLVLTLVLVCALAVTAMAASVGLSVDEDIVKPGDTVTVVVTLGEAVSIEAGSTAVQGTLNYDKAALTYVSGAAGAGYEYLTIANNNNKSRVGFYYLSMSDPQVPVALPAGTVVVLTFQANEAAAVTDATFSLTFGASDCTGASTLENTAGSVSVKVCPNHVYEVTDGTPGTCMEPGTATYTCATCGDSYTETTGGDHTLVHMDAVEPGCHYTGNIEHWYCTVCETVWQDEALTQVTNHMNVIVPALGGEVVHVEAVEATCFSEGNIEYWYCEQCEQVWQDEALTQLTNFKNVIVPATEHNLVHMDAVAPGCHFTGNIEHWYCTICETVWQDEALTQITNHMNVIIPALGGEVVHVEAVEPSCYAEGNIEHWYCEECEQVWQDEALTQLTNHKNVIIPAAHTGLVHMDAVEPGCHYTGNIEHWYCTDCETVWQDEALTQITNHKSVILPALGGEVRHVNAAEATCTTDGHIEYWYCPECNQVWQDEALTQLTNWKNIITEPALGHIDELLENGDEGQDGLCDRCGNNAKTGDFGIIVAVASAIVSMTGVVVLPVAKKKFF